jgi:site-specific DNA recombinase
VLPTRRVAALRDLRAAHGVVLGEQPDRLPLPAWPTSASKADPDRPKNLYLREDRILPHLRALWVLLSGADLEPGAVPPATTEVISHLRAQKITLTYGPQASALKADTPREVKITLDPTR